MSREEQWLCPHCESEFTYPKYRCNTQGMEYGSCSFDGDEFTEHECDDSETTDYDNYEYFCPRCDHELDTSDIEPINREEQEAPVDPEPAPVTNISLPRVRQLYKGQHVIASFGGRRDVSCIISINERGIVFFCQNVLNGDVCPELFGMKYSWNTSRTATNECIEHFNIRELEPVAANDE